ncbi:unnamed protein product [Rotaria magnacalcarata]|uniref:VOC domain-containing protein n=2 Tax=Rotaria magnacalcarata TaxID=392030 RepID=A0A816V072_9BILA|nr:unnamed protein product [Rotaria magnacalcarata]
MVVDETVGLHHVEFHTKEPQRLMNIFINTYGFHLSATKTGPNYSQWLLESYQCRLIISSVLSSMPSNENNFNKDAYDILTTLLTDETTRDLIMNRDTVFNLGLTVNSVQSILDRSPDLQVLVSHRRAMDEYGSIDYACIKSSVGNVVHTILDMSNYSGLYLPGFIAVVANSHRNLEFDEATMSDIDHVAIAVPRGCASSTVSWYERVLGMARFPINREDDPFQGFLVHVGSMGMRMFAGIYWKCSETGCADSSKKLKLVFVESLINENSDASDQITTFIKNHHGQGGIQHIAFACVDSIKSAVRITKAKGAAFLTPCLEYYSSENNGRAIEAAGESSNELSDLGILLDDEADNDDVISSTSNGTNTSRILLQIFTKSLFGNDTFFLELIERRGANGFGSGNVRTLWKIVQNHMDRNV